MGEIKYFKVEIKSWQLTLPRLLQSTVASSSRPVSRFGQAAPESRDAEPGGTTRSSMVADGSLFKTFQEEDETILKIGDATICGKSDQPRGQEQDSLI